MFASRLQAARKPKGLKGRELAEMLGISYSSYSKYESTDRKPDIDMLVRIADILDVTTDYLLGRTDERKVYITENPPELADIDVTEVGQSSPFTDEQLVALKEMFADMQKGQ